MPPLTTLRSRTPRYAGRHVAPRRRILAPALMTGVLATATAVAVAPEATSAPTSHPHSQSASPARADEARTSRSSDDQRIVLGQRLRARPPAFVLPVVGYHLTGRFGQSSGLWAHTHTGLDFAAPEGTDIRSIGVGTVVSTAYDGAYGNKTVVRLLDGTVLWYCHQSAFDVHPGERVRTGQVIGRIGSTGNTTGPHLHLEVHPHGGGPIDPEAWLPTRGLHP